MAAGFFSCLCLILGALAVRRRSATWTVAACLAALGALFCHTLCVLLLPGLLTAIVAAAVAARRPIPLRIWAILLATITVAGLAIWFYLWPLAQNWNNGAEWGYTVLHSVAASINQVGCSVALLALLGAVALWHDCPAQGAYWTIWMVLWAVASVVFPLVLAFHPAYLFAFAFGPFVLAGYAVHVVYQILLVRGRLAAMTWVVVVLGLSMPSVASYYTDGARPNYRTVALYIEKHAQSGDRVTGVSHRNLAFYSPACEKSMGLPDNPVPALQEMIAQPGRIWIVIPSGRSGKEEKLRRWLAEHCSQELVVHQQRFDYRDFTVELFVSPPARTGDRKEFPATNSPLSQRGSTTPSG